MGHDPFEHVGRALFPVEPRIGVVERIEHRADHAGFRSGEHAFGDQRLEPFHHDRADHLDRRGRADRPIVDRRLHAERGERGGRIARMRAADEQRRAVKARMDGRHHRHVDVTRPRGVDLFRRALFRLRRAGIAVEKERALGEARDRRDRRLVRLIGGDHGKDRPGALDRLGSGRGAEDVGPGVVGALALPHRGIGSIGLDVVGRDDGGEAGNGAPAGQKRLRGFAKTDERDRAVFVSGSPIGAFTPGSRASGRRGRRGRARP